MPTKSIDVTGDPLVAEFIRKLSPVQQPIHIMLEGQAVARLMPIEEQTDLEKEKILQEGWLAVQRARARNRRKAEQEIGMAVDAAVRRSRADK